jgi:hypothetical protein
MSTHGLSYNVDRMGARRALVYWSTVGAALATAIVVGLPFPRNDWFRVLVILALAPALAFIGWGLSRLRSRWTAPAPGFLWLGYGAPAFCVWLVSSLAFFPAIMGSDGTDEWNQAIGTRPLDDWHTVGHILTLRALMKLWPTPAALVVVQLSALSGLVAWGCLILRRLGAPRSSVVAASLLIAVAPVNWVTVVTILKDVPYACGVFALTLLVLERTQPSSARISTGFWVAFACAGLVAMSYRHTGAAAVLGAAFMLVLLEVTARWKPLLVGAGTIGIAIGLHALLIWMTGAVPMPTSYGFVGIVAAHVKAHTALSAQERADLARLRPTSEDWPYDCLTSDVTTFDGHFEMGPLISGEVNLSTLAARLTLRAPSVTLRHMSCRSSAIWRLADPARPVAGTELTFGPAGQVTTIAPLPPGPPSHSLLPRLRKKLGILVWRSGYQKWDWLFWRPAEALYALLLSVAIACARRRTPRLAAVVGPLLSHTMALALFMPAQDGRYQFPLVLAFQLLALPFVRLRHEPTFAMGDSSSVERSGASRGRAGERFDALQVRGPVDVALGE